MSEGENPPLPPDVQRKIRQMTEEERRRAQEKEKENRAD